MPLNNFDPKLSPEAREAISAAFDAIATFHGELAASSEKVVGKMGNAARAVGWPEPIVSGMATQIQSLTKMQQQMMDHLIDAWQAQISSPNPMAQMPSVMLSKLQSWPGMLAPGTWPGAEAFTAASSNPVQFWTQLGEQWQKNWAQMMTQWPK